MKKKLAPCVPAIALCVLIPTEKPWAQAESHKDFSMGGFVGGQLAQAFQHLNKVRNDEWIDARRPANAESEVTALQSAAPASYGEIIEAEATGS